MAGKQATKNSSKFLSEAEAIALELGDKKTVASKSSVRSTKSSVKKFASEKSKKLVKNVVSSSKKIVLQDSVVSSGAASKSVPVEPETVSTKTVSVAEVSSSPEPVYEPTPFAGADPGLIEMFGGLTMVLILFELIVIFILLVMLFLR
jgi:hypothetical protein